MKISDINIDELTPMMKQYVDIKLQHQDKIIFFRLGEFYEMFFEDAITASHALEIALTGKSAGLKERIPMCGVPVHSYSNYLEKLVDLGYKVAIVEQLEEAGKSKLVDRGVVQVVTPGTIIKEDISTNYIASYAIESGKQVLSFASISTGELYTKVLENNLLESELIKYNIKEVVTNEDITLPNQYVVSSCSDVAPYQNLYGDCDVIYQFGINLLMSYIELLHSKELVHFKSVEVIVDDLRMKLDVNAIDTLELVSSNRTSQKFGTLFWYLDKTSTAMGSRMLKNWIISPLKSREEIEKRYSVVDTLISNFLMLNDLQGCLKDVYDLDRICAKISVGSANARDLIWLRNSLRAIPGIKSLLSDIGIDVAIEEFDDLVHMITAAIDEDAPITIKDGKIIKYGYNSVLDELKDISNNGAQWLIDLELREKERTGIKNLKVKYNKVFGYFIEVSNSNLHLVKDEFGYERKQTLSSGERFVTAELKEKEDMILNVATRLVKMEYDLFIDIRNSIKAQIASIQRCASIISEIDCLCAFAYVADKESLVKPTFNDRNVINIKGCKHPVVEKATNCLFVKNDVVFDSNQNVMIITGPNMSGKSTYMRQCALTAIMAQIGSYVACDSAELMIFDAIYTRIGASDDLSSGQSTFMLEMLEANNAISNATSNSLVLFDELGRGTSTYDGMSITHSIIEYMSEKVGAKTLFSTHYHELTSLENDKIFNVHASVIEEDGKVIFKHRIENGAASKSYGIYVAQLAKLPDAIIESSYKALKHYEESNHKGGEVRFEYINVESEIEKRLQDIDINSLSPIEALNLLNEMKKSLS